MFSNIVQYEECTFRYMKWQVILRGRDLISYMLKNRKKSLPLKIICQISKLLIKIYRNLKKIGLSLNFNL